MNCPLLITGCQRSGTTLLLLILDSHPEIRGVDESQYWRNENLRDYLEHPAFAPVVAWKLPLLAHGLDQFASLPGLRVLWCVRDPRDVVLSMLDLHLKLDSRISLSWAAHPGGARREIERCSRLLSREQSAALAPFKERYRCFLAADPLTLPEEEILFAGALCWRIKNSLLPAYAAAGLEPAIVRYEELISEPERITRTIADLIGLQWSEAMLRHHETHQGTSVGGTDNARPIDPRNRDKWRRRLSPAALSLIGEVCGETAVAWGYELSSDGGSPHLAR